MAWFRRKEKRSISYQDVFGTGGDVSAVFGSGESRALQLVPVFAASRLLCDSVASLPLQSFRKSGEVRQPVPLPDLFDSPSQHGTTYDWVFRGMSSLVLRGNAFGLPTVFDRDGFPTQVEWLHPDSVTLLRDSTMGPPQWYVEGRPVDDLIHVPGYVLPGRILGLSPIKAFALSVDTGLLSATFGRDWFANGKVPSAILSSDKEITQPQAEEVKARFLANATARQPVVLGNGLEYKPLMVPPEESQFIQTMKATTNQIASIYGIPPEMIGGESGSSMTYSNVEQQAINFVMHTLRPYVTKLESAFDRLLPQGQFVRFNVDALIRADLSTRYAAHAIGLQNGFLNRDEVRALEDRPPIPGGKGQQYAPIPTPSPSPVGGK